MTLCEIHIKGQESGSGWWQFEVLPRAGELVDIGSVDLHNVYQAAAVIHIPVRRDEVTEFRPPYVRLVLERLPRLQTK